MESRFGGIDVSKATLVVAMTDERTVVTVPNTTTGWQRSVATARHRRCPAW